MSRPVKVYKAGRCEVAIFKSDKFDSYSFKFQKSYKDQGGEWKNTDYFSDTDMGDLAILCDKIRQGRIKERGTEPKPVQPEPSQQDDFDDDLPF